MVERFDKNISENNDLWSELRDIMDDITKDFEDENLKEYKDTLTSLSNEVVSIDEFLAKAESAANEILSSEDAKDIMKQKLEEIESVRDTIKEEFEEIKKHIYEKPLSQLTENEKTRLAELERKVARANIEKNAVDIGLKIEKILWTLWSFGTFLSELFWKLLQKADIELTWIKK